ncbi:MAG TPA: ABC transporter ATP-binding protein [Streptosporangiaceae bacterium]|nr:ABC transporter ATP-binding protein [Streptosporangiaceae bacterium]
MPVIEVDGLVKRYGRQVAVDGVSFTVGEGEIFGILGPNGAGKTTAVECVEGLRRPDAGAVRVLGLDPRADGPELRQRIGVQLQETHLPDQIKVWEALELHASFYRDPRDWREVLDEWGLAEKRDAKFSKLSGGQKQRLFIALALVGNPRVAFLDELTAGLDPQARRATWELIKKIRAGGVTVVLVSHFMDEVEELCDRVAIFEGGKIAAMDTPAGLINQVVPEQRMRFRPMAEFDVGVLSALPGVQEIYRSGDHITVTGTGDFAGAVTAALARQHVLVADLRLEERSLDDAYVALTGRTFEL